MASDYPFLINLRSYVLDSIDLNFALDKGNTGVISRLTMRRNQQSQDESTDLTLFGEDIILISVALDGKH